MADSQESRGLRQSLGDAFATRDLRLLQITWGTSATALWAFFVAFYVYAYNEGGAAAVGVAALVQGLPAGLLAPLAGMLADRRSRRDVMLDSTLDRAVLLFVLALAVTMGAPLFVAILLSGLVTVIGTPHKPSHASLLPAVAETPRQLAAANAVWNAIDNAGFFVGALVGGILVAATSAQVAFAVMGLIFLAASVLLLRIAPDPIPEHRAAADDDEEEETELRQAILGFREVATNSGPRLIVTMLTAAALVEGTLDVLVVVMALEILDLGEAGVGWLNAAWGLGGLLGGAVTLSLMSRGRLAAGLVAGGLFVGAPLILIGVAPIAPLALALLLALGVGYALIEVAGSTLLQRLTPDEVLGRVFATVESTYWIAGGIGALIAPLLVSGLGDREALIAVGVLLPVLVALRWVALNRFEAGVEIPERPYRVMRGLPLFAPLPLATVETIALRAEELHVPAGGIVISEGETGDAFYAIEDGVLDPYCERGAFPTMYPGDFFGEIALLRDIPRTATVCAQTDSVLWKIGRDAFLQSITGQKRSLSSAKSVADTRFERVPVAK